MSGMRAPPLRVGLVSDTHGLLRPEALAALAGSDVIIHAGDIGSADVLEAFARIAPVHAVRGNNDRGTWARALPDTLTLELGARRIFVLHDLATLAIDPAAAGIVVVVSGHSHRPRSVTRGGVLFVNPGSAGPRRFSLPVSVAHLVVRADGVDAALDTLTVAPASPRRSPVAAHRALRP